MFSNNKATPVCVRKRKVTFAHYLAALEVG